MLSLTYTKEDRGVADQVYSNAWFDGYMNLIDGYAPWYSVGGTHMKTAQTRKNFWIPFSRKKTIMRVILTLRSWKTSS